MVRLPEFVNISFVVFEFKLTVPAIVPVPVNVMPNLLASTLLPKVNVTPDVTESVVAIVTVFAAPVRIQLPLTVREFKVIVGTAVMAADCALLMIISSPATGSPLFQFPAVVHAPPVVGVHVVVFALIIKDENTKTTAIKATLYTGYELFIEL